MQLSAEFKGCQGLGNVRGLAGKLQVKKDALIEMREWFRRGNLKDGDPVWAAIFYPKKLWAGHFIFCLACFFVWLGDDQFYPIIACRK